MNLFLYLFLLILFVQIVFFLIAAYFKTDKVTDLSYGLTFILAAFFGLISKHTYQPYQVLLVILISIWGLRLAGYLLIRIMKIKRDRRFDGIREDYLKFASFWFFQAIAIWIILLPSTYLLSLQGKASLNSTMYLGIFVWLVGFLLETMADYQKYTFKNQPKNKDKWIQSGLWKYSRYPNYFGEMLCWWGIFIFSLPFQTGLSWLTLLGPSFITFILLFVSGIPPLEKRYAEKYKNNSAYQAYKNNTRLLVPLPKLPSL